MSVYGTLLGGLGVRRKIFVSYHHANDQYYYNEFSRIFSDGYETIRDNSLDRRIDSDNSDYVIRKIREDYLTGTSCTIVLCGPETRWRKFVDWEIKATLDKEHGLVAVGLPNNPIIQGGTHKPDRLQDNIDSGYAVYVPWSDIITAPHILSQKIEVANSNNKIFIANNRALRKRNGA